METGRRNHLGMDEGGCDGEQRLVQGLRGKQLLDGVRLVGSG